MKTRNHGIARTLGFGLSAAAIGIVAVLAMSAGTLIAVKPAAGGSATCKDLPITLTVVAIQGAAVLGDGNPYKDGVDGVYNTVVHVCYPSYDATIGLITSKRSMTFAFTPVTAGSPAWTSLVVKPFINVNNILWGLQTGNPDFTTHMFFSYLKLPIDRSDYRVNFQPGLANIDAKGDLMPAPDTAVNTPYASSSVLVESTTTTDGCPVDLNGNQTYKPHWTITPVQSSNYPGFIGTLVRIATSRVSAKQIGQYNMPFQLQIDATGCLDATFKKVVQ
jgi:hypothetical protein